MYPKISVIIVNWNGKHFLQECLKSLLNSSYKNFEIVFVDNGSTDGSLDYIYNNYQKQIISNKIRLVKSITNLGFAGGNNLGYKNVDKNAKYVILLNNDTKVDKNWIKEMYLVIENDENCGGVCSIDNNLRTSETNWFDYHNSWFTYNLSYDLITFPQKNADNLERIWAISLAGCSFMFRKEIVKTPFDDDYFAYAEDIYLSRLILLKGYQLYYAPKAYMQHYTESTKKRSEQLNLFLLFHGTKNKIMNFLIFYEREYLFKLAPLLIISQLAIIIADPKRISISLKAYTWILKHLKAIKMKRQNIQHQRKVEDKVILKLQSCKIYSESNQQIKLNKYFKIALGAVNSASYSYCKLLNIKTREFY